MDCEILAHIESAFQKVTLARQEGHVGLLINGCLQFHSADRAPLHELLVTLPLCLHREPWSVLVLGGGIGLTAREALRFPEVERVTLVEIDPELLELSRTHPIMKTLHQDAFSDPRVELIVDDAFAYVASTERRFDLIVNAMDVSFTPQKEPVTVDFIKRFWTTERRLLRSSGFLSDYLNDVELGEFFEGGEEAALRELPRALSEGMEQSLGQVYRASHAGTQVFALATLDKEPLQLRRTPPPGCEYLTPRRIRRFLRRA